MAGHRLVRLPSHDFLYTVDQVALLLAVSDDWLSARLTRVGRTLKPSKDALMTVNIAGPEERPEWRISERELRRWLTRQGFKITRAMKQ